MHRKVKVFRPPPLPVAAAKPLAERGVLGALGLVPSGRPQPKQPVPPPKIVVGPAPPTPPESTIKVNGMPVNRPRGVRKRTKDDAGHCRREMLRYVDLAFGKHRSRPDQFFWMTDLEPLKLLLAKLPGVVEHLQQQQDSALASLDPTSR